MNKRKLTTGKVSTALLTFAVPFLFANVLQALYGAMDLLVVGQFNGPSAISAVSIGSQMMQAITGIIGGISMGGTVLIGHCIGKEDDKRSAKAVGTLAILFIILAIILTPLIFFNINNLIPLLQTPAEAIAEAKDYIYICTLGIPFIVGYNAVSGIYRGMGDSKTPMYLIGLACAINVIVDFVLVGYFKMGAAGAAIATISAQGVSFIVALLYIRKSGFSFPLSRKDFAIDKTSLKKILKVGAPLAVQDGLVSISFLIITAVINTMGVTASAAVGVVEKVIVFAMLVPSAFGSSVATMTSQNLGANKPERATASLKLGIIYSLCFGIFVFVYCQIFPATLTSIFSSDAKVIEIAGSYLKSYSMDCILVSFVFCFNAYFSGGGNALVSFTHSMLATFLIRVPGSYLLSRKFSSLFIIGLAAPLASVLSLIICLGYFWWQNKSQKNKIKEYKLSENK
ncbi:MAG: MATE family efflux transporter [Coprobacillaceae bacterium]